MKIFPSIMYDSACDYHRIVNPLRCMGGIEEVYEPEKADILIFNKVTSLNIEKLKAAGIKIVMDIDDYWYLPENHFFYNNWKVLKITDRIIESMPLADAILTTNDLLADKIRAYNKNVHVVPNALPYGQGQFDLKQADWTGKVVFVGGKSHNHDIKLISGYQIPKRLPVESYMRHYEDANICLAPLVDNEFNRYKSNLKILEAGAACAYFLGSNVEPYRGAPTVAVLPGEWEEEIDNALKSPEYAQLKGHRLNMWCREYYELTKINELRTKIFASL